MWRGLRVISLWEPWATLMALDEKRIETRPWGTEFRGLLAIAATRTMPPGGKAACLTFPFLQQLSHHGVDFGSDCRSYGRIIAVTELVDVVNTDGYFFASSLLAPGYCPARYDREFGNYAKGRKAWQTRGVRRLIRGVPWSGKQGLRNHE
jgi:hypothetical protein